MVGSPAFRWHCVHCEFLYRPLGCLSSRCTFACTWHDMHSLFGSKVNRSKSEGLWPRWQARQVCSACLNLRSNLVRAPWLKFVGVNLSPLDEWQVSQRGGEPKSLNRSP